MLHQAGFNNAVATLGTALTQEHLPILKRGNPKIIVAYDGDKAGLNAAFKASKLLSHSDFEGGVIIFPQGVDPADMVQNKQIEELNNIFSNPIDFVAFALDFIISQYDLNTPLQKQKAWGEANEYLQALSPIIRSEYTQYIASKLNINQNIINISSQPQRRKTVQLASVDISELEIIKTLLENDKLINIVLNTIDPDMFVTHKAEFEMLINEPDNPQLRGLLIREDIKTYDEDSLKQRLNMMLINYYTNQLTQVKYSDTANKAKQLRKLQEKIFRLKQGKDLIY
jgi:DNA primase